MARSKANARCESKNQKPGCISGAAPTHKNAWSSSTGHEEAALKLLFLALRQAAKKWTMPIHHWREALNHFTIFWPERMPALERIAQ